MKNFTSLLVMGIMLLASTFFQTPVKAQLTTPSSVPLIHQMVSSTSGTYTRRDTVKDAGTVSLKKTLAPTASRIAVQVNALKIDGTTSVKCVLRSSLDGNVYNPHFGTSADTFTLTNVSTLQSKTFEIGTAGVRVGWEMLLIGTGTQNTQVQSFIRYVN